MKNLSTLLPKASGKHGTRIGWHFIKDFLDCPYLWYTANLAPHPGGSAVPSGPVDVEDLMMDESEESAPDVKPVISPPGRGYTWLYTPVPIWIGGAFHAGREGWLLSGWRDGNFDPDAGRIALARACEDKRAELPGEGDWIDACAAVETLLEGYMRWCGPGGPDPEWERVRIVDVECAKCKGTGRVRTERTNDLEPLDQPCSCDHGRAPLIEHEWEIDLGYGGYFYTTRIDTVVIRCADDVLSADECKTCDTNRAAADYRAWRLDPQLTGEQYALEQTWGIHGQRCGVNLDHVIKRAGKGGKGRPPRDLRDFHILDRNERRLENFRRQMVRTLMQLDTHIGEYRELIAKGVPEPLAGRMAFSSEVPGSRCAWCIMQDVCDLSVEPNHAAHSTKPRHKMETTP